MSIRFELKKSLQEYLDAGDANTREFLADEIFQTALNRTYEFFAHELFVEGNGLKAPAAFLSLNAFMLWLASLRMALTGHAAATFPLFRTALESACYAHLVHKDEGKEALWLKRHDGEKDMAACRGAFTPAVREVSKVINDVQPGSGDIILEMYNGAIDFGAHPNTKSVLRHVKEGPDEDVEFWRFRFVGVHHRDSVEAKASLVAALEFAWVIALIIFRTIDEGSEGQVKALTEIHDLKEEVVAQWFAERRGEISSLTDVEATVSSNPDEPAAI